MSTIDSHHHFWRFNEQEYGWIEPGQTALRRDFLPEDLEAELRTARIDGVVTVQARQSLAETNWLLGLAQRHSFIRGVVGWVPLIEPTVAATLSELSGRTSKLRSVRHVLQGEPDDYMLTAAFNRGVAALAQFGLAYDLLIHEQQMASAIVFVDRHPGQIFVLDHIAKPKIARDEREPWASRLAELARRPNVYCKISGMVTEADGNRWTEASLHPYFEHVLSVFSPARLMFGSDWPVCLDRCSYSRWREIVAGWTAPLSAAEQDRIFGGTAIEAYRL